jgi:hypothetical protein
MKSSLVRLSAPEPIFWFLRVMQVGPKYSNLIMSSIAKTGTLQRILSSFRRGILCFQSASLHLTSKHVPKRAIATMLLPAMHMDDRKLVVPCSLPYENNRESSWSRPLSLQAKLPDHLSLKVRRIMLGH